MSPRLFLVHVRVRYSALLLPFFTKARGEARALGGAAQERHGLEAFDGRNLVATQHLCVCVARLRVFFLFFSERKGEPFGSRKGRRGPRRNESEERPDSSGKTGPEKHASYVYDDTGHFASTRRLTQLARCSMLRMYTLILSREKGTEVGS